MPITRRLVFAGAATALLGFAVQAPSQWAGASSWTVTPVVTDLQTPRGVAFDGAGSLYVVEAGLPGSASHGLTTGFVDKYSLSGGATKTWSTAFGSAYAVEGGGPPDVLGPAGISAVGNGCTKNGNGKRNGCKVLMIESLSSHEVPNGFAGHLFGLNAATGASTDLADVGDQDYAWTLAHQSVFSDFPDSNPYGVLVTHGGSAASGDTFVINAASNTVDRISADGTATPIAYIPNETPVPGLPTRDATPTCAAMGPDGSLYIGTLDLVRNFVDPNQGRAHIYRVDPKGGGDIFSNAQVWASGLTTLTSCTFDSAGNFWGTEMFKNNAAGLPGDVVRIPFSDPTSIEHIGGGEVPFPGGIAQGPDGAIYASVFSAGTVTANGEVVRISQ